MDLTPEDIAKEELDLTWKIVIKSGIINCFPLVGALFFNSLYVKVPLWLVSLFLFWNSIILFGHSLIALLIAVIPIYIYFEIDDPPKWLAYASGLIIVFQIVFISNRVKQIGNLRKQLD